MLKTLLCMHTNTVPLYSIVFSISTSSLLFCCLTESSGTGCQAALRLYSTSYNRVTACETNSSALKHYEQPPPTGLSEQINYVYFGDA